MFGAQWRYVASARACEGTRAESRNAWIVPQHGSCVNRIFSFGGAPHFLPPPRFCGPPACARLAPRADFHPARMAAKFRDAYAPLSADANAVSVRRTPPGSLSPRSPGDNAETPARRRSRAHLGSAPAPWAADRAHRRASSTLSCAVSARASAGSKAYWALSARPRAPRPNRPRRDRTENSRIRSGSAAH